MKLTHLHFLYFILEGKNSIVFSFVFFMAVQNALAQPFSVYAFNNIPISTDSLFKKNSLIVLLSENSCTGCKDELAKYLDNLDIDTLSYEIFIIQYLRGSSSLFKRQISSEIKSYYPRIRQVYFDVLGDSTNKDQSIFMHYEVKQTPTILFYHQQTKKLELIAYKKIFSGIYLSPFIKERILKFFLKG